MRIFENNAQTAGQTPLVRLRNVTEGCYGNVLAKIEGRNFSYSIKGRCVPGMLDAAEQAGKLSQGMTVIEATSGNTGIALAFACAARGYELTLTMPDSMSIERRRLLEALGTNVVLTPGEDFIRGAIRRATELASHPNYYYLDQFSNKDNADCHFRSTGPEVWNDTDGKTDVLVACVGSGGTLTGISRYFEVERGKPLHSVAVEPETCTALSGGPIGSHRIPGMGSGFIPDVLDVNLVDEVVTVADDDAFDMAPRMALEEGILCGISGGAAVVAAIKVAMRPESKGKNIVVILADSGERYLSTDLFIPKKEVVTANGDSEESLP